MNSIWDNAYQNRWSWAKKAEAEFKQNLQKLKVDDLPINNAQRDITIGVYGPTQVGKTTLILRLLGIRQEALDMISDWLRGKRQYGNSATVTATEYRRSADDHFHFFSKETGWRRGLSGEELEQVLSEVRNLVETNGEISTDQIIIELANIFFEEDVNSLQFIDLPGVQSAEPSERKQVMECVSRWLPLCEITLLVDDATRINDYAQIEDKNVKHWMNETERFRLVPTCACSLESLHEGLKHNPRKEFLKKFYGKEVSRALDSALERTLETNEISKIIYPLDMGMTLQSLKESDNDLFQIVGPIMESMLKDLRDDLYIQSPESLHFKRLASLYKKAEQEKVYELKQIEHNISILESKHKTQSKLIKGFEHSRDRQLGKIKHYIFELDHLINDLKVQIKRIKGYQWEKELKDAFKQIQYEKKATSLNNRASTLLIKWEGVFEQEIQSLSKDFSYIMIDTIIKVPEINYSVEFVNPGLDIYLFQKSFDKAIEQVKNSTYKFINAYFDKLVLMASDLLNELKTKKSNEIKKLEGLREIKEKELANEISRLHHLESKIKELNEDYQSLEAAWKKELEQCHMLEQHFQKYAVLYYHYLRQLMIRGSIRKKWQAHHLLFLLKEDSEMVIGYLKGKELERK